MKPVKTMHHHVASFETYYKNEYWHVKKSNERLPGTLIFKSRS